MAGSAEPAEGREGRIRRSAGRSGIRARRRVAARRRDGRWVQTENRAMRTCDERACCATTVRRRTTSTDGGATRTGRGGHIPRTPQNRWSKPISKLPIIHIMSSSRDSGLPDRSCGGGPGVTPAMRMTLPSAGLAPAGHPRRPPAPAPGMLSPRLGTVRTRRRRPGRAARVADACNRRAFGAVRTMAHAGFAVVVDAGLRPTDALRNRPPPPGSPTVSTSMMNESQ